MKQRVFKKHKRKQGFSLAELIVVVGILMIIVGMLAAYALRDYPAKGRNQDRKQKVTAIVTALNQWSLVSGRYEPANIPLIATCIGTDRAGGKGLWANDDVKLSNDPGTTTQTYPAVAFDASGNSVIVWRDDRNGNGDIYAQKFDPSGNRLWNSTDVKVSSDPGTATQAFPVVAIDSGGNAIVVWRDNRNGATNYDIYGQKLDINGGKLWSATDVRITSLSSNVDQYIPAVAIDSQNNAVVAWNDRRGVTDDIYAQKLSPVGSKMWASADVRINQDQGMATNWGVSLIIDASNNPIFTWMDSRNGNNDIYAQKRDPTGTTELWTSTDVKINSATGTGSNQASPVLAFDESGNIIFAWDDSRNGNGDIYAQKFDPTGTTKLWNSADVKVSGDPGVANQYFPVIATDASGRSIILWRDSRNSTTDIYGQKMDTGGNKLWTSTDVRINSITPTTQTYPAIATDAYGNALAVWRDDHNGNSDIYGQKISGGCYNLATLLVPEQFDAIPEDPKNTNGQTDTGFTIYKKTTTNEIVISAPSAELGETINAARK